MINLFYIDGIFLLLTSWSLLFCLLRLDFSLPSIRPRYGFVGREQSCTQTTFFVSMETCRLLNQVYHIHQPCLQWDDRPLFPTASQAAILTRDKEMKYDINLLKPTGYVMHQQFNIQQMYALPTLYVFCIYLRTNSDLCHLQHKLIGFYDRWKVFTARYGLGL